MSLKYLYLCSLKIYIMISSIIIGMIGPWQIAIIVLVIILLFGGKKIPELMKGMGKGIREFKDGMNPDDKENSNSETKEK